MQERFERPRKPRPREEHLLILDRLSEAEVFETFLQTKYVGQTRFSMEGAESSIVILSELCAAAADGGMAEVSIGMPHRGRLNVLTNVVGKLYSQVFREFDNKVPTEEDITGDVKYHLGATGQFTAMSGRRSRSRWPRIPATWRPSIRCWRALRGPSVIVSRFPPTTPCCRSSCTATRRSRRRASSTRCCR